jgi:hypothetical protein
LFLALTALAAALTAGVADATTVRVDADVLFGGFGALEGLGGLAGFAALAAVIALAGFTGVAGLAFLAALAGAGRGDLGFDAAFVFVLAWLVVEDVGDGVTASAETALAVVMFMASLSKIQCIPFI